VEFGRWWQGPREIVEKFQKGQKTSNARFPRRCRNKGPKGEGRREKSMFEQCQGSGTSFGTYGQNQQRGKVRVSYDCKGQVWPNKAAWWQVQAAISQIATEDRQTTRQGRGGHWRGTDGLLKFQTELCV